MSLTNLKAMKDTPTAVQLLRKSLDTSGTVIGNGNPYEMSYATFVTFRDGLIVNYRKYWNPMAFIAAMSGTRFDTLQPNVRI